jgi:hypothetical protein
MKPADVEQFMQHNDIVQLTAPATESATGVLINTDYSAVLVGGRWLHGATIADILEQI